MPMPRPNWLLGALLLGAVGTLPGCSFLFTTAPKRAESPTEFASNKCTTSKAAPIVDTVIAGLQGVRTVYAATTDKSTYTNAPISREADIAIGLGFFALYGASAIYGYYVTGQCTARRDRAVILERPQEPEMPERWEPDRRNPPRSRPAPQPELAP